MAKGNYTETPLMKQYYNIKASHPDAILLFRVGDFYETFGEDAVRSSKILEITLTKRANVELAGFPYHALDNYLPRLVKAGERVAICEQLEDPKTTKKIVKRGVIELVTPGVTYSDSVVTQRENSFLAAIYFGKKSIGVAFLDITTGEFVTAEGSSDYISKLIATFRPKEILYQRSLRERYFDTFGSAYYSYHLEEWVFSLDSAEQKLKSLLGVSSLRSYGIESAKNSIVAAGAILYYLELTEHRETSHITTISRIDEDRYVWIDRYSIANLEIFRSNSPDGTSFIDIIDKSSSPMGGRMLRRWCSLPLKDRGEIEQRLAITTLLVEDQPLRDNLREIVSEIGDLERLAAKVSVARINPREVIRLKEGLEGINQIKEILSQSSNKTFKQWSREINSFEALASRIATVITPEPAVLIQKGGVIAHGFNSELDELRAISLGGKEYLQAVQQRESEQAGIPLKIGFNNVFGYYIEVRNTHKDKVPQEWIRKQTLTGAERYITAELKEYEEKILGAEDKIQALENKIYGELLIELSSYVAAIQSAATRVATIDVLLSFSILATESGYVCPQVNDGDIIDIKQGRHPVIESLLPIGEPYIPNDIYLDNENQQVVIITGPNMSGKSAILRQTALIVLLAQIGCYVPCQSASIGIVDKIFTRVGASDNLSKGESTFMVEMIESASILNNITSKSLVLLDEIGRGTSTYDGISIAWAMVEFLHEATGKQAKTLFATHYHELNQMQSSYGRIKNFHVEVKEVGNKVLFVRTLKPEGTQHSFGIHVAQMAGMPRFVIERAKSMLSLLESQRDNSVFNSSDTKADYSQFKEHVSTTVNKSDNTQLSLFQLDDPLLYQIRDEIKGIDVNNMTPLDALNKLSDIKRLLGI